MKKIKQLKTGRFSRNLGLFKMISSVGKDYLFSGKDLTSDRLGEALVKRMDLIGSELGQIKGSFLKAGQMLSLYAEDLLPPEVENILKKLQSENHYLSWEQISKQIPEQIKSELKISPEAFAAASIGQVHKAFDDKNTELALKIQYKDIDKVIDMDLKLLRMIVSMMGIIPNQVKIDGIFDEIKIMLIQEMDYKHELHSIQTFRELVGNDFIIPAPITNFCSETTICTEYIHGQKIEDAVIHLNQEQRNKLAYEFFELFFLELFKWKLVQSDAHTGNYLIKNQKWVLFDFGATKKLEDKTAKMYQDLISLLPNLNESDLFDMIRKYGHIDIERSNKKSIYDYFELISRPFREKNFDWGESDIAKQAINKGKDLMGHVKFHSVPQDTIFLDRKIAGLYYMLKILKAKGDIIPRQYLL